MMLSQNPIFQRSNIPVFQHFLKYPRHINFILE